MNEFGELIKECFKPIIDDNGKFRGHTFQYPKGCDDCDSTDSWDCKNELYECPWRENHWKYDEIKRIIFLEKLQRGGMDLNRLQSEITMADFLKVAIIKEVL